MSTNAWAGVLMVTLAALIAVGFIAMWLRDKGRADEQAQDPERMTTDTHLGPNAREGAADEPPVLRRERRHRT